MDSSVSLSDGVKSPKEESSTQTPDHPQSSANQSDQQKQPEEEESSNQDQQSHEQKQHDEESSKQAQQSHELKQHEEEESPKQTDDNGTGNTEPTHPWYVLIPHNTPCMIWEVIMGIVMIYSSVIIPFDLAFVKDDDTTFGTTDWIAFGFYVADMFLTCFFIAYSEKETKVLVTNPLRIAFKYLKSWFIIDLISVLPLDEFRKIKNFPKPLLLVIQILSIVNLLRLWKMRVTPLLARADLIINKIPLLAKTDVKIKKKIVAWISNLLLSLFLFHLGVCVSWYTVEMIRKGQPSGSSWERYLTVSIITVAFVTINLATSFFLAIIACRVVLKKIFPDLADVHILEFIREAILAGIGLEELPEGSTLMAFIQETRNEQERNRVTIGTFSRELENVTKSITSLETRMHYMDIDLASVAGKVKGNKLHKVPFPEGYGGTSAGPLKLKGAEE